MHPVTFGRIELVSNTFDCCFLRVAPLICFRLQQVPWTWWRTCWRGGEGLMWDAYVTVLILLLARKV